MPQGLVNETLRKLESHSSTSALKMKRDSGVYCFNLRVAKGKCKPLNRLSNRVEALQDDIEEDFQRLGQHLR